MSKAKSGGTGYYLKLALTLLVISAVVSGLLGLTNFVTRTKSLQSMQIKPLPP